jgi:di/tricarboxylate transporter
VSGERNKISNWGTAPVRREIPLPPVVALIFWLIVVLFQVRLKNKNMKNFDKNPLVWFIIVYVFGWWFVEAGDFNMFVIFILAVILSKQIEILSRMK